MFYTSYCVEIKWTQLWFWRVAMKESHPGKHINLGHYHHTSIPNWYKENNNKKHATMSTLLNVFLTIFWCFFFHFQILNCGRQKTTLKQFRQFLFKQLHPNARKISSKLAATASEQTEKLKYFHLHSLLCLLIFLWSTPTWFKRSHNENLFSVPWHFHCILS